MGGWLYQVTIVHQYLRAEREGDWFLHHCYLRDMWRYSHDCAESDIMQYSLTQRYFTIFFSFLELCQVYTSYSCTWDDTDSWRRHKGRLPQRQTCMPAQWWKAVFQDQFEKQTMIRYDWVRSGLRWRTMSPKQRAEWIVTHPVLQRMAKLMENMFVEDKTSR